MKEQSFADILKRKIEKNESAFCENIHTFSTSLEPANLSFLIGTMAVFPAKSLGKYQRSPNKQSSSMSKPHHFTEEQKISFSWFSTMGVELSEGFTKKELKSAFRKLALILHPDVAQSSKNDLFLLLKQHFFTLEKVFIPNPITNSSRR